jgi:hypothetical protein
MRRRKVGNEMKPHDIRANCKPNKKNRMDLQTGEMLEEALVYGGGLGAHACKGDGEEQALVLVLGFGERADKIADLLLVAGSLRRKKSRGLTTNLAGNASSS